MRIGLSTISAGQAHLDEAFALARRVGAEGIEVVYGGKAGAKSLERWADQAEELTALSEKHSLAVTGLNLGFLCDAPTLTGPRQTASRWQPVIRDALTVAAAVKAGAVVVPFFARNAIETQDHLDRAAGALADLVEGAEEASVVLGIESTLNFGRQQFLLDFLGNSAFAKVCYDTGEALARKLDPPTGIRDLGGGHIAPVHFKDVRVAEGQPPDFRVALGEGSVDFRAAAQALRAVGYDGWVVVEAPPTGDPLATARKNVEFAKQILAAT
ncbi:MAG: sugar phosphate isomerase/epimerase [Phycisphaerae bacterium]|nr:sugar phosphate isomerase/epimerase [Phycisphaerae bacterium]